MLDRKNSKSFVSYLIIISLFFCSKNHQVFSQVLQCHLALSEYKYSRWFWAWYVPSDVECREYHIPNKKDLLRECV